MNWKEKLKKKLADAVPESDFLQMVEGLNTFRVLPNASWQPGMDIAEYPTLLQYIKHFGVGPKGRVVVCGKDPDTGEGRCLLCDESIPKLKGSANAKSREQADRMRPSLQAVVLALPVRNGNFLPPKVMEFPIGGGAKGWGVRLLDILLRDGKFYEHPIKGRNIVVHKKIDNSKKPPNNTSYPTVELEDEPSAIPKALFDARSPLETHIPTYDEAAVIAALKGEDYKPAQGSGDGSEWGEAVAEGGAEGWGGEAVTEGWDEPAAEAEAVEDTGVYEAVEEAAAAEEGWPQEGDASEATGDEWPSEEAAAEVSTGEGSEGWDETLWEEPAAPAPVKQPMKQPPTKQAPVKVAAPPVKQPPTKQAAAPVKQPSAAPVKTPVKQPPVKQAAPPVKQAAPPVKQPPMKQAAAPVKMPPTKVPMKRVG